MRHTRQQDPLVRTAADRMHNVMTTINLNRSDIKTKEGACVSFGGLVRLAEESISLLCLWKSSHSVAAPSSAILALFLLLSAFLPCASRL